MYEVDKYTASLLHFDSDFTDETGKVWTAHGNPAVSSVQSKFGGKSLYLDGSSYIQTPYSNDFTFGSGDFTIDWWEYRTLTTLASTLISGSTYSPIAGAIIGSNIIFDLSSNGTSYDIAHDVTMGAAIYNAWTHYALVRSGTSIMTFQNGILKSTITSTSSIFNSGYATIGGIWTGTAFVQPFGGYVDELRISKGIARWTGNFDPVSVKTNNLLRITMNDSSDHDYQLSSDEIAAFVKWYNGHASTDTHAYGIGKKIGTQVSTEYVAFEKIISFEVI